MTKDELMAELLIERFGPKQTPPPMVHVVVVVDDELSRYRRRKLLAQLPGLPGRRKTLRRVS